ncbi:hypothetical protein Ccrd_018503, partial [Cynara cardunculus var. scolymus]
IERSCESLWSAASRRKYSTSTFVFWLQSYTSMTRTTSSPFILYLQQFSKHLEIRNQELICTFNIFKHIVGAGHYEAFQTGIEIFRR